MAEFGVVKTASGAFERFFKPGTVHTVVVGPIAAGKTSFLREFKAFWDHRHFSYPIMTYPEPVEQWRRYSTTGFNYLDHMYYNPADYAFTFQVVAAVTKHAQIRNMHPISVVERHFDCQKRVFIPMLYEKGYLTTQERDVLNDLLDSYTCDPKFEPDIMVYLNCSPETSLRRIQERGRQEEQHVDMAYLQSVKDKYDDWIREYEEGGGKLLTINTDEGFQEGFYQALEEFIQVAHTLKS
jgi:deoxyadenosine/deoxycytidine kinase